MTNLSTSSEDFLPMQEAFHNAFFYFLKALHVMSLNQADQLAEMNHANAAWEIQHDVLDQGAALIDWTPGMLQLPENEAIRGFLRLVETMPTSALSSGDQAMRHSAWIEVRTGAKKLLVQLEDARARNHEYFETQKPVDSQS